MFSFNAIEKYTSYVQQSAEMLELRLLLANLKKSVEMFLAAGGQINNASSQEFQQFEASCIEVIQHGFRLLTNKPTPATFDQTKTTSETDVFSKLKEDFEWLLRSAELRLSFSIATESHDALSLTLPQPNTTSLGQSSQMSAPPKIYVKQYLQLWLHHSLKLNCLSACLQALVTDKELLDFYYTENALMRNDDYATAFFICLSAFELRQGSLLSQIENDLYNTNVINDMRGKHKRTSSHPNFALLPPKRFLSLPEDPDKETKINKIKTMQPAQKMNLPETTQIFLPTFRKVKSLPIIKSESFTESLETDRTDSNEVSSTRPRSKTMFNQIAASKPKDIPKQKEQNHITIVSPATSGLPSTPSPTAINTSSSLSSEDLQPSTSAGLTQKLNSASPTSLSCSEGTTVITPSKHIEIINCDDIKIWTDQSYELRQQQQPKESPTSWAIPPNSLSAKHPKSVSPINSFLCNLFSTPPTYTKWAVSKNHENQLEVSFAHPTENEERSFPCNTSAVSTADFSMSTTSIFDSFLPVDGKKLRKPNNQNLFEDSISSLDYSTTATNRCLDANKTNDCNIQADNSKTKSNTNLNSTAHPKDCQSLTAFLQMSQFSRNNTDLEKENAHFRISEAIISAIEHIKWAKSEPDKYRKNPNETATDWLQNDKQDNSGDSIENQFATIYEEYIPYAELGESCLDLLSAEVVGLSLISKFSEYQLPKVHELKWLVSDEDTPQTLLPMPDDSPTNNPDENIMPSMMRGTKYWAPPRQQIIFTDFPTPNRRDVIQKQNNRCAGCGMRVAPQYLHSFRYCTYLGKYHCTGCHRNQISAIPAKILQDWDFKCYPVSVFAYRLLEKIYNYPLFYVPDLNPVLYVRSNKLLTARSKRIHLKYVKLFITTCRFAVSEQKYFDTVPDYITSDPDTWSISDFMDVHNKSFHYSIDELVEKCENHIFNCLLCTARGFICEYCHKEQVLYPWQTKTFRCERCASCFHLNCWKSMSEQCCKCQRISKRKEKDVDV